MEGPAPAWAADGRGFQVQAAGEGRATIVAPGCEPAPLQPIIDRLRGDRRTIVAVQPVRETLEDLFMRAVRDPVTGEILEPGAGPREADKERRRP